VDLRLTHDAELLRAVHDKHAHCLLSYVVGLTHDRANAQDIVQETLLRAWRNPASLEQTGGSARGWLFTVARHIVIDQWRSVSRRPEVLTDLVPEQAVQDTAQQTVDRQLVHAALRTLSIEHRQALFETYFRGASVAEAAHPRRATRHRQIPHPLRALRATTGNRRGARRRQAPTSTDRLTGLTVVTTIGSPAPVNAMESRRQFRRRAE
jgi:RNA polymerase sigma-70 factor, ECF subfamily